MHIQVLQVLDKKQTEGKKSDKRSAHCADISQQIQFNRATFRSNRDLRQALSNKHHKAEEAIYRHKDFQYVHSSMVLLEWVNQSRAG